MDCNNHMLCLGDCPKTFKSLTYNHIHCHNVGAQFIMAYIIDRILGTDTLVIVSIIF